MSNPPPRRVELRHLLEQEEEHGDSERQKRARALAVLAPVVAAGLLVLFVWLLGGGALAGKLVGVAFVSFTVLGKFVIFTGLDAEAPFGPWELAALVAFMDMCIATVLVMNLPVLYRIPKAGDKLEDLAEHGHHMLETKPWLGRVTVLGVVAFVMFPLTGTGAIGGSIFGRLLGLSARRTLAAIATGAVVGTSLMAAFAETLQTVFTEEFRRSWEFRASGAGALLIVVVVLWWRGKKLSEELRARKARRLAESPDGG